MKTFNHEFDSCLSDLKFHGSCVTFLSVYSRLFSNTELALVTLLTGTSSETLPVKLFLCSTIDLKKLYVTMYNLGVRHVLNKN